MLTLSNATDFDAQLQLLIDRALDIARGGNGQIEAAEADQEKKDA